MKKVVGYSVVFVVVFITSAVVNLPAQFVFQQLPLPLPLQVMGVQGTIWQGSAEQVRWQGRHLGDMRWQLKPSALLAANVEVDVRFGRGSELSLRGKGTLGYGLSGLYAENAIVSMPADIALAQAPLSLPIEAQGQLELSINQYRYQAPFCSSAEGSLVWSSANVESLLGVLALNQVMADLQCSDNTLTVKGKQNSQQVGSEFSAQLNPNLSYQADGWFKPGAEFPESLAQQLKWLPEPDAQGRYSFKHQGHL
ncbi:MAG: type II secretion system protein N [Vibrio sp.]|uniref:type II secretion system protein N n=1 Tax=Vibrio sp. TaxID=678 RepID=UPI003A866414